MPPCYLVGVWRQIYQIKVMVGGGREHNESLKKITVRKGMEKTPSPGQVASHN